MDEPRRKPLELTMRRAVNADAPAVRELVFGVLGEYGLKPDPAKTDRDLDDIEQSYIVQGGTFMVLETVDGVIAGSYGLYPIDDRTCELRKMYLQKEYRGRGWGRCMMDDALVRARRLGFTKMTLETASVLVEAIALYRRYGFQPYQPPYLSRRCDQAYVLDLE